MYTERLAWSFRIAKFLVRCRLRGGHRLLKLARRLGHLDRVVRYSLGNGIAIDVPLFREDNCFDAREVWRYERQLMRSLAPVVAKLTCPVVLIDGGADIGLFTTRLAANHPNIALVHAYEPNADACQWLRRNLGMLRIETVTHCAAVGESPGLGTLKNPDGDLSDHAKYFENSNSGSIPVSRIDDLQLDMCGASLVLKLDVEGAELSALRGAATTIERAREAVVVFEANPRVAARTAIDPVECLRLLQSIRPFAFRVGERPKIVLSTNRSVFEQLDRRRVYNLVANSSDNRRPLR